MGAHQEGKGQMGLGRMFLGFTTEGKSAFPALREHPILCCVLPASLSQHGGGEPQLLPGQGELPCVILGAVRGKGLLMLVHCAREGPHRQYLPSCPVPEPRGKPAPFLSPSWH